MMFNLLASNLTMNEVVLQSTGLIVVFICLISLAVVIFLVGKIFIWLENRQKQQVAAPATPASSAPKAGAPVPAASPAGSGLTPELIAVIAAAVDTALDGRSHRILDISQSASTAWSISGRTDIFASHRLKK